MPAVSVIIPTYNRPEELADCIESLLFQTVPPTEVIVVDDGQLEVFPFREECEAKGILCVYHQKENRGLTKSRNAGVHLATGDILFFLDDDVVLFKDYVEVVLNAYAGSDDQTVKGVGGVIVNTEALSAGYRLRHLVDLVFLISGRREGRVLPSGFSTDYGTTARPLADVETVDFLPGCAISFRKEIFDKFAFSEKYKGYGMGEDKDFTYRVSREYKLLVAPGAKLVHRHSPKMRLDKTEETKAIVLGRYHIFRDYVMKHPWDWFFFYYASFGYLLERVFICLVCPKKAHFQRVKGIFFAFYEIIFGKIDE